MRKYLFVLACALTIVGCRQKQGQTAGDTAMADSVQTEETIDGKSFTPAEIGSAWTSKDIAVPNGGQQPGVIALLDAFSRVWPTDVASFVMGLAQDPKFEFFANRDTGGGVSVDRKNGYVNAMPGDAPGDVLKVAVWTRSNGHRLLGLHIFTPQGGIMPEGSALCFYDYDPTTETMTPEKDNAVLRFKPSKDHFAQYEFPNLGRDMLVGDTDKSYDATWHVFAWDGMNFKEETSYTDDDLRKAVVGLWMNVDKKFPFTFRISADDEGWPVITDCGIYGSTEYDAHLSCYEGRVVVAEQSPKGDDEEEDEDERFEPSLVCHFRLTKDGRLTGGYYMKQPGGKEYNGIMTLEKQSALNDYAE